MLVTGYFSGGGARYAAYHVPVTTFERLVLCRTMASDHIIGHYERALVNFLPEDERCLIPQFILLMWAIRTRYLTEMEL